MPELPYSIDDFQARFPDLQRRGRGLAGPCPLCGGEDRFHVNRDGVFGCRGCIDDDAPQAAENVKAIFRLLEGEDTSPRQGTTYSRHVCGRFCVDYERVDGRGQIRQHRDDGLPKKDRHWTTPSLGKRPATHVRLYGPTSGPVVLCEGEKAARAVEDAGYRAASWLGGTSGVGRASFSRLQDLDVILWQDADKPGLRAMARVAEKLRGVASRVLTVDTSTMPGVVGGDHPDRNGTDAADMDADARIAMIEAAEDREAVEKPTYTWYSDRDFLEPWDTTPDADCMRALRMHGDKLLCVKHEGAHMTLRIVTAGGRWSEDPDAIGKLVGDAALQWAGDALRAEGISPGQTGEIARYAKKLRSDEGRQKALRSVGRVVERWRYDRALPNGLKVVKAEELDRDSRYLGAPNGMIDLNTESLLTGAEARSKLVTRQVPDPYDPNATHPDVDRLLGHLPEASRSFLVNAFGHALWGKVGRRFYVLLGPPAGGKSTLLEAVTAALGDVKTIGYGQVINGSAILEQRFPVAHQGNLFGIQDSRIAVVSELPDGKAKLNVSLIKSLDGIGGLTQRDVGEKAGPSRPATGTLFVSVNDADIDRIPLTDRAMRDRIRILHYPPLPEGGRDEEMVDRVRTVPEIRQAMVAKLVRAAMKHRNAPPDIPSVRSAVDERFRDSIGDVGSWLLDNIVADPGGELAADELWDRLASEFGKEEEKIRGWTRQRLLRKLAPEVVLGWPRRAERRGVGGESRVYRGVRLCPVMGSERVEEGTRLRM